MSGKKYPMLSTPLYFYAQITREIAKNKLSVEAQANPMLEAAECNMMKFLFFDKSTKESEYYYIATCKLFICVIYISSLDSSLSSPRPLV